MLAILKLERRERKAIMYAFVPEEINTKSLYMIRHGITLKRPLELKTINEVSRQITLFFFPFT
jgi:hypothetical protein